MIATNIEKPFRTKNKTAMTLRKMLCRTWFCAVLFVLLMGSNVVFSQRAYKNYADKYKELSIRLMNETGIPASVILGVAMLESGMGTSKNARLLHNHFGIVGRNSLHRKKGTTYRSRYREYPSDTASFKHFVQLLSRKKWFAALQGKQEYAVWLKHMNHAGYSTAGREWVKRVTSLITRYKLFKLDEDMSYSSI